MSRKHLLILAAAAVLAVGATLGALTASHRSRGAAAAPPLYRGSIPPAGVPLPPFALPRYDGGSISSTALRGRVVLATFVDSACHDKCPIIVGIIGRALPRLTRADRAQIVPLAFSVDPKVDTRAHVRRFLTERGALGLRYVVGTVSQMRPVWKLFAVLPAVETGDANVHSADVRIFDRHGTWVSTLHAGLDLTPANLVHDARLALRSSN